MADRQRLSLVSRLLPMVGLLCPLLLSCISQSTTPHKVGGIDITSVVLDNVFPVFYQYYDDQPLGTVTLFNKENSTIKDIKLIFFVRDYMTAPKECPAPSQLAPGESRNVDIFALFTDRVMGVTEASRATAEIAVEYGTVGKSNRMLTTASTTVRIQSRNAMALGDVRRLAAFVTANDSTISTFSRGVVSCIRDRGPEGIDAKLLAAIGVFSTMELFGIVFVSPPGPTFAERISNRDAVIVQFPVQTLEHKGGDYPDLSILYSALLESAGVQTAIVTVPGNSLTALCLGLSAEKAHASFSAPDNLIFRRDQSWILVDVTRIGDGFLKAWQLGAKQWREAAARNQAGFFPLQEAWKDYEPVGLAGSAAMTLPDKDAIISAFLQQLGFLACIGKAARGDGPL